MKIAFVNDSEKIVVNIVLGNAPGDVTAPAGCKKVEAESWMKAGIGYLIEDGQRLPIPAQPMSIDDQLIAMQEAADAYVASRYNHIAEKQLNRFGAFGNEAQKAEAAKVSAWVDSITLECMARCEKILAGEPQSTDFTQFDETDPKVSVFAIQAMK